MFARWLQRQWFDQRRLSPALWLLLPLSLLYILVSWLNRRLTRPQRLPVPVVVVGNITVGGAGKTPLALALVAALKARGWRPGIISRGYGRSTNDVRAVRTDARAAEVGDEPLLMARRSGVPVFVGQRRHAAGLALLAAHPDVNVLVCDDGLQHVALARDVELAVFDARGFGNGWRLPMGPLREPLGRLSEVDAVVAPREVCLTDAAPRFASELQPGAFYRLSNPAEICDSSHFSSSPQLCAVAGIGHPERFFNTLRGLGLQGDFRAFPDHHAFGRDDLAFAAGRVLLMTEKDAVKCAAFAPADTWVLPVDAIVPEALIDLIVEKLRGRPLA